MPEDNQKQNPNESCMNKYQKHVACSYGYKLVCVDDKFSEPFKLYLHEELFTILLIVWLKEASALVVWWNEKTF